MADGSGIRVAAIDCGTNSIRLLISQVGSDGATDVVREMRIVRLGQGVDETGRLAPEAIERTLGAVREYAALIDAFDVERVVFGATSAVRDAGNAAEFADSVEQILGVHPRVLSGAEEAAASFLGATRELNAGRTLVADIGGGSTELVVGAGGVVEWSVSLDIGSVRLTERFLHGDPPSVAEIGDCTEFLDDVLAPAVAGLEPIETFVGVAGTVTTVAADVLGLPSYDSEAIHASRLDLEAVRASCLSLLSSSVAQRRTLGFMHPGRADVIGAGALVLDRLIVGLPLAGDRLVVSERDILDGLVWQVASGELV